MPAYCFTITFSLNDSGFQHFTGDLAAIKSLAQRIYRSLKNVLSGLSQVDRYILPVILITEQPFCHQTHTTFIPADSVYRYVCPPPGYICTAAAGQIRTAAPSGGQSHRVGCVRAVGLFAERCHDSGGG